MFDNNQSYENLPEAERLKGYQRTSISTKETQIYAKK